MDHDTFLTALERDARAFAEAARAGWDAEVRACPDWRMPDLVWHLGEVHNFWRTIAGERLTDWKGYVEPERPSDDALLAWYEAGVDTLVSTLRDADPDTEVFTWAPQKNIAFIVRRMAQETAVHRWDAEDAAGRSYEIDPALAADGVDEFLSFFLANPNKETPPVGGTVHLHATDAEGEWLVRPNGETSPFEVTREHAKGDAALRGRAEDLLLALWRRRPVDAVEVIGDTGVATRFLAHTNLE